MDDQKRNIPLMVAFSIPILMIIVISASIYLPVMFIKPIGKFVYSTGNDYCTHRYVVKAGRVVEKPAIKEQNASNCPNSTEVKIYLYDVASNRSQEIQPEEAGNYLVDDSLTSQDGFEVVSGSSGGDFIFSYGGHYQEKYLKKGSYSRKLDIKSRGYYDFNFIGWVKGGNNG